MSAVVAMPWLQVGTAFALGLIGSGHCVLVCGPLIAAHAASASDVSATGAAPSRGGRRGLEHALGLHAGRVTVYMLLAAVVAGGGHVVSGLAGFADLLRTIAAALLILMGLHLLGWSRGVITVETSIRTVLIRTVRAARLHTSGHPGFSTVATGVAWGAMPCGMVYTMIVWAGLTANAALACVLMLAFGLGTVPALLTTGLFATRIRAVLRHMRPAGGAALIAVGVLTLPWLQSVVVHRVLPTLPPEFRALADLCSTPSGARL